MQFRSWWPPCGRAAGGPFGVAHFLGFRPHPFPMATQFFARRGARHQGWARPASILRFHGGFIDAELHRDGIGGFEPDATNVARQAIGILRHDLHGIAAVGLVDAHRPGRHADLQSTAKEKGCYGRAGSRRGFSRRRHRVRSFSEAAAVLGGTVLTAMERGYLSSWRLMRWTVPTPT